MMPGNVILTRAISRPEWQGGEFLVDRYRNPLINLIAQGKQRGFITFQEVNAYLPDVGGSPRMVDELVLALEQSGLGLIEEPDQPRAALPTRPAETPVDLQRAQEDERVESFKKTGSSILSSSDHVRM